MLLDVSADLRGDCCFGQTNVRIVDLRIAIYPLLSTFIHDLFSHHYGFMNICSMKKFIEHFHKLKN